jgi:hypothetical protein
MTAPAAGAFSGDPLIRKVGVRLWRLEETLAYRSRAGRLFVVDVGFFTDGASVPRAVWWLYPPFGDRYDRAAILHDFLYQHAERYDGDDHGHISRAEVDALFREAMEVDGFRASGRAVVYAAVRSGGWAAWRAHRHAAGAASVEASRDG